MRITAASLGYIAFVAAAFASADRNLRSGPGGSSANAISGSSASTSSFNGPTSLDIAPTSSGVTPLKNHNGPPTGGKGVTTAGVNGNKGSNSTPKSKRPKSKRPRRPRRPRHGRRTNRNNNTPPQAGVTSGQTKQVKAQGGGTGATVTQTDGGRGQKGSVAAPGM